MEVRVLFPAPIGYDSRMNVMRRFFIWLAAIDIVGLTWGGLIYAEPYSFWNYPLSYIGRTLSYPQEIPNSSAQLVFRIVFVLNCLGLLIMAYRLWADRSKWPAMITAVSAIGFLIAAFNPDDTAHQGHVVGSAIAIGFLWLLGTTTIKQRRAQLFIQIPLISYFIIYCWFDYSWYPATFQKIAMVCLLYGFITGSSKTAIDRPTAAA